MILKKKNHQDSNKESGTSPSFINRPLGDDALPGKLGSWFLLYLFILAYLADIQKEEENET